MTRPRRWDDRDDRAPGSGTRPRGRRPPIGASGGSTSAQIASARQHRVRNRQPVGGSIGLGSSPASTMRRRCVLARRIGDRHRRQQRLRVRMLRRSVHLIGWTRLDDLAEVHDRDAVGQLANDGEVVGDEHVRQPQPGAQVDQQAHDLGLDADVERRHRFVEHEQRRRDRQGSGDADALALAARELVRVPVEVLGSAAARAAAVRRPCW